MSASGRSSADCFPRGTWRSAHGCHVCSRAYLRVRLAMAGPATVDAWRTRRPGPPTAGKPRSEADARWFVPHTHIGRIGRSGLWQGGSGRWVGLCVAARWWPCACGMGFGSPRRRSVSLCGRSQSVSGLWRRKGRMARGRRCQDAGVPRVRVAWDCRIFRSAGDDGLVVMVVDARQRCGLPLSARWPGCRRALRAAALHGLRRSPEQVICSSKNLFAHPREAGIQ